ncbi:MAG: response regulator [Candidatus Lindowbacteria bacterium]|nr:response regulator [Candidatus Lindowbacteria bacterium]
MSKQTILVVEDDPMQRLQLVRVLENAGYNVLQASTGHETIRILESQEIALILTDRKMPWMDGDWLLNYVKTNYSRIPVVFATAYPEETGDLKPDALLAKPFDQHELKEVVRRLIRKDKPHDK